MKEAQHGVFEQSAELMLNLNNLTVLGLNRTCRAVGCLSSAAQVTGLPATQCWSRSITMGKLSPANAIQQSLKLKCSRESPY